MTLQYSTRPTAEAMRNGTRDRKVGRWSKFLLLMVLPTALAGVGVLPWLLPLL